MNEINELIEELDDDDSYPTEDDLKTIREWEFYQVEGVSAYDRYLEFMEFIKRKWWMPSWGWHTRDDRPGKYYISTGGWSGNESLISAMKQNWMFWHICWQMSRVGGHYIFQLPQHESFKEVK